MKLGHMDASFLSLICEGLKKIEHPDFIKKFIFI